VTHARTTLRAAVGAGQLVYGVVRLRRQGTGWYHVVLGLRQLGQARLDAVGASSPAADAAVDGIHVATMLAVALVAPAHRAGALRGAGHALAWTLLDAALRRRPAEPR
jgi:hypothetical protein